MSQNLTQFPGTHASAVWLRTLDQILREGHDAAPRGKPTRELPQHTVVVDLRHPLVMSPARKLSYRFAAAEALWILAGDDRVEPLAKYAPRMLEFSDDGVTLAGAYGPRIVEQLEYVIAKLCDDRDTRQAVLTMWKPCPPPSKDIPCTIALDFKIRGGLLNCHAFMRSSDAWLGLPYDVFSFAAVATYVACRYNAQQDVGEKFVALGSLYLTAASSHLYAPNFSAAKDCLADGAAPRGRGVPDHHIAAGNWARVERELTELRDSVITSLWEGP